MPRVLAAAKETIMPPPDADLQLHVAVAPRARFSTEEYREKMQAIHDRMEAVAQGIEDGSISFDDED